MLLMLGVIYAVSQISLFYVFHSAECRYTEGRHDECRGALFCWQNDISPI